MELAALMNAQALRGSVQLAPIDGPEGRIFPPTYPADDGARDKNPRHVVEELRDGQRRVLIDSVASQANRQEAALVAAREAGLIDFADVYVDLSGTEASADYLSATQMPHRLADAILHDSEIDGTRFAESEIGRCILSATPEDLSVILETSPSSLLFGAWFSRLDRPLKIQRVTVSEIWADNAVLGKAVSSRIDPLGIEALDLYESREGDWTVLAEKAALINGKPKPYPAKAGVSKKAKPSVIGHSNIKPQIRDQGITAERITLRWAMPLAAIRRLHFGGEQRDGAGQAYIAALGVLARVLAHDAGYSLRSRCDLISAGPITLDTIDRDGVIVSHKVGKDDALRLFRQAEDGMRKAGLKLHQKITAKPSQKFIDLIAVNSRTRELDGEAADAEVA